jgi:hypothetical protein
MRTTTRKDYTINVRLPAALFDRLYVVAGRESNNVASVIRRLVSSGLDREGAKDPKLPKER